MDKSDYVQKRDYHAALMACVAIIVGLLIIIFARPKSAVSQRQLDGAVADLKDALEIVEVQMNDPSVPVEEYYDNLCDDIYDALAWLGADPP